MAKLYLVEGIPGVGKTTHAKRLKEELEQQGKAVVLYEEGDSHPADMAWQAYLTKNEYDEYVNECRKVWEKIKKPNDFSEIEGLIKKQVRVEDAHYVVAYTKFNFPIEDYWHTVGSIANKELCDGRSPFKEFRDVHLARWSNFAKNAENDTRYIFECAFLQNHIFELMGFYEFDKEFIFAYLKNLLATVSVLEPEIIYIKPNDIKKVIDYAAEERIGPRGRWIDDIAGWVSDCPYGMRHGLKGVEGVYQFCEDKMDLDMYLIGRLEVEYRVIKRKIGRY